MTSKPSRRICSTRIAICISPRADFKRPRSFRFVDLSERCAGLANEALANIPGGQKFSFAPGERRIVDQMCMRIVGGSISTN